MVDDSDDPAPNGARTRNGQSKLKYMNQLQEVANRERDEIVIDLNDVEAVSTKREYGGAGLIQAVREGVFRRRAQLQADRVDRTQRPPLYRYRLARGRQVFAATDERSEVCCSHAKRKAQH